MTLDLNIRFPKKPLPSRPFIGLFGNHQNNWREWATRTLLQFGVAVDQIYESSNNGWGIVNDASGDQLQIWINELVKRQHYAMQNALAIVFSLDSKSRYWQLNDLTAQASIPTAKGSKAGSVFAARCELGWLAAMDKPTFVWIPDDLEGRNYLRAVVSLYDCLVPIKNIFEGCKLAAELLKERSQKE